MDRLELHDRRDPVGRDTPPDGEELAKPVLLCALPNQKEVMQDVNEAVFVDRN